MSSEVGGDIDGDGGACDGFAFVRLTADFFETLISQIAAVSGLIALIGLVTIALRRTRIAEVVPEDEMIDQSGAPETEPIQDGDTASAGRADVEPEPEAGPMGGPEPGAEEPVTDGPTPVEPEDDEGYPPTT